MKAPLGECDRQRDDCEIRSLSDRSGVGLTEVRTMFRHELARLGMGARVESYLSVLTAANVRSMLRRRARRSCSAQLASDEASAPSESARPSVVLKADLRSWEDDGGMVPEAP